MSTKKNVFLEQGLERLSNIRYGVQDQGLKSLQAGPVDTEWDKGTTPSSFTYSKTEKSYSGTDVTVVVIYNEEMVILGNLQTITYSIHRDKMPVRTLGRTYAKNYVRGQRTIAGSMVFIQFDEAPLYMLYRFMKDQKLENEHRFSSPVTDEIPPFDMMFIFNNEYGASSILRLYGVEITDEGGTFSINDIYSENVMQFLAKDIDPMFSSGDDDEFKKLMFTKMTQGKILDPHYNSLLEYKVKLERSLSEIDSKISKLSRLAQKNLRSVKDSDYTTTASGEYSRVQQRRHDQNTERINARAEYKLLTQQRERILIELERMGTTISDYEKTKMTWDLNSSQEANYTNDAVFTN